MITDEQKLMLADKLIAFVQESMTTEDLPIMVGRLNAVQGINGFKKADIGHEVFEYKDRYIIYLVSIDEKFMVQIPYYKPTLTPYIDFI